ncbi:MAG: rod shape-determining protein MreC [Spirochaetales bacterium]|nr:rod shape-determining protein MreC [Spirochaetales bacterium]
MRGIKPFIDKYRTVILFTVLVITSSFSLGVSTGELVVKPAEVGFQIVSVFQRGLSGVESFFSNTIASFAELKRLRLAYNELKDRISDYENVQSDLDKLKLENSRLKAELGFTESISFSYVPAEVIAKDPTDYFNGIIINKGSLAGVEKGQTVIAFNEGMEGLVGRIIRTAPFSSQIMPITDKNSYVSSRLMTSRYQGLIRGLHNSEDLLAMDYVKKKARRDIQYGDLIVTSGLNSIFPKDIYIGKLTTINSREWETSLTLELETMVDFSKLEYVYILKKEGSDE